MYNRYIPNGNTYTRVVEQDREPGGPRPQGGGQGASAPDRRPPEAPERHDPVQPPQHTQARQTQPPRQLQQPQPTSPFGGLFSGLTGNKKNTGIAGILDSLKLDDLDSGDILLILILLFLFRDGDDIELLITLGLLLLLGLGDKKEAAEQKPAQEED